MEVAASSSHLEAHRELLTSAQPLKAKVDRNLQVFKPLSRATHFDLPKHFFNLTLEEIKKEQKQRCVCSNIPPLLFDRTVTTVYTFSTTVMYNYV